MLIITINQLTRMSIYSMNYRLQKLSQFSLVLFIFSYIIITPSIQWHLICFVRRIPKMFFTIYNCRKFLKFFLDRNQLYHLYAWSNNYIWWSNELFTAEIFFVEKVRIWLVNMGNIWENISFCAYLCFYHTHISYILIWL